MPVLVGVRSGLYRIGYERETQVISSNMMILVPAGIPHFVQTMTAQVSAWLIQIPSDAIADLGSEPRVLQLTKLMDGLCERIVEFGPLEEGKKTETQKRLVSTFLDELRIAPAPKYLSVPMPTTVKLVKIAKFIISHPNDRQQLNHWAEVAQMSRRSFTDRFAKETGLSFAVWRQRVRLEASLSMLEEGRKINDIALSLGFSSPAHFITAFRAQFSISPRRYFALIAPDSKSAK